jgi:hypothetical protein
VKRAVKLGVALALPANRDCAAKVLYNRLMLFLVIEQFRDNNPNPVRERFLRDGRMLPEGVVYHASWVDPPRARCYQIMEAPDLDQLRLWTNSWEDLVDFEIVPVLTSQDYWAKFESES